MDEDKTEQEKIKKDEENYLYKDIKKSLKPPFHKPHHVSNKVSSTWSIASASQVIQPPTSLIPMVMSRNNNDGHTNTRTFDTNYKKPAFRIKRLSRDMSMVVLQKF